AQVGEAVAEVAGLLGAAGGHRGRVEVDDHPLPAERGQLYLVAFRVRQAEIGRRIAGFESLGGHEVTSLMNGARARKARPRWLIASLASGVISAVVWQKPCGTKIGS